MVAVLASACTQRAPFSEPELSAPQRLAEDPAPASEDAFLNELLTMPMAAVRVEYDVSGPGGMHGTLEIIAKRGGFRSERWALQMPTPDGEPLSLEGETVATPQMRWTTTPDAVPELRPSPLYAIASAYVELDAPDRLKIIEQVRGWYDDLERGRQEYPAEQGSFVGQPCMESKVIGHSICLWEATGLPLQYVSDAFTVTATAIDRSPEIEPSVFALPDRGRRVVASQAALDVDEALERLRNGDLTDVTQFGQPSLQVVAAG